MPRLLEIALLIIIIAYVFLPLTIDILKVVYLKLKSEKQDVEKFIEHEKENTNNERFTN